MLRHRRDQAPSALPCRTLLILVSVLLPLALFLVAPAVQAEDKAQNELSLVTFEEVWSTIHTSYYDADFGGLDWEAIGEKYRPDASKATNAAELRPILNAMLKELGESHFGVIPSSEDLEEQALIGQAEIEVDSETPPADENDRSDDEKAPSGSYSGIHLRMLGPDVLISRVMPDSPAAKAGLRAGQRVSRIGKLDVETFLAKSASMASKSFSKDYFVLSVLGELIGEPNKGDSLVITVVDPRGRQQPKTVRYRPIQYPGKMSAAMANMGSMPIRYEDKQLPLPHGDVLYLGFNIFLPDVMSQLRTSINERSDDVIGLIVDLRGNPGGIGLMASGLAGLLTEKQYSLGQMTMRSGKINFVAFPQQNAFLGPIAVLVDAMSASTSEIFAAGLQEAGRARVFGRPTMGAALPSFIRKLPNGDRLQHAIADMRTTKGRRVEGRGVIPDKKIPLQPNKLFAGQDPVLDKAMQWLQRQTNVNTP